MTALRLSVVSLAFLLISCSAGRHLPPSEPTDKVPPSWMSGDFNNVPAMSSFFGVELRRVSEGYWSTLKPTGPSGIEAITVRREPQVEDRFNSRRDNGDFVVSFNDHACFELDVLEKRLGQLSVEAQPPECFHCIQKKYDGPALRQMRFHWQGKRSDWTGDGNNYKTRRELYIFIKAKERKQPRCIRELKVDLTTWVD